MNSKQRRQQKRKAYKWTGEFLKTIEDSLIRIKDGKSSVEQELEDVRKAKSLVELIKQEK